MDTVKTSLRGGPQGRRGNLGFKRKIASSLMLLAMTFAVIPAHAAEIPADYLTRMARVDFLMRRQEFKLAAAELGQVPKEQQQDPLFRKYADRVIAELYQKHLKTSGGAASRRVMQDVIKERLRVTRHRIDSDSRSDQNSDNKGWQVNQRLAADVEGKDGIRAKFQLDLEGYKNGHNDVRYRTVLADFYEGPGPAEAPNQSHFALGDTATYTSPYFLRGSRLRGLNVILHGDLNEFQAVAGGYPVWLEGRDEYVYPRTVLGARDRWKIFDDRIRLGIGFVNSRDSEKIRTDDGANPGAPVSTANQVRDNFVYSLDQEIKLIPDTWFFKAAEAYSHTDDNLLSNRFGDTTKLKDTSFMAESLFIQPWFRSNTRFERTGPDFRLATDFPQGAVNFPKGITADRLLVEQILDFNPMGPFDTDFEASWIRNGLDNDDWIEQTRERWITGNLDILVPPGYPRPSLRATMTELVSSPGPTSRPNQTRTYGAHGELAHTFEGIHATAFTDYESEFPQKEKDRFSPEERWSFGTRLATTLLERIVVSPHYTYRITDEDFDSFTVDRQTIERREKGRHHEAGLSTSTRLWSPSSLGLSYDYLSGKLARPDASGPLVPTVAHTGTASFTWPYNHYTWNKKRKWSVFPGVNFYYPDLEDALERRPEISSRMTLGYEVFDQWKLELMGEYRYDKDEEYNNVRTTESRIWLLWKSQWK